MVGGGNKKYLNDSAEVVGVLIWETVVTVLMAVMDRLFPFFLRPDVFVALHSYTSGLFQTKHKRYSTQQTEKKREEKKGPQKERE